MAQYRIEKAVRNIRVVLARFDGDYKVTVWKADGSSKLFHTEVYPSEYCPKAPPGILEAKDPAGSFIKYPRLKVWHPYAKDVYLQAIKKETLREVSFCEVLRHYPHPNVASYQGCIVKDSLIRGICFSRYEKTLNEVVNPGLKTKKNRFQYGRHQLPRGRDLYMLGLRAGIAHIHSLGHIHCDIGPHNLMVKPNGTAVVIDFNSCVKVGSPIRVGRSDSWHNPEAFYAEPKVDDNALHNVGEWLSDKRVKDYRFVDEVECAKWYKSHDRK